MSLGINLYDAAHDLYVWGQRQTPPILKSAGDLTWCINGHNARDEITVREQLISELNEARGVEGFDPEPLILGAKTEIARLVTFIDWWTEHGGY